AQLAQVADELAQLGPLQARRGRGLVEQQRHGPRLLGPGQQHRVAAQRHRLVPQLVAVDPGEDAGQPRVGHAVGDAVQQVEVARPARASCGRPGGRPRSWPRSCPRPARCSPRPW
uniref:Uncharacterized protein n=1 Tax=Chelydra serpentina TaxID=8475 RepID=A0A8C3RLP6_CHESE